MCHNGKDKKLFPSWIVVGGSGVNDILSRADNSLVTSY